MASSNSVRINLDAVDNTKGAFLGMQNNIAGAILKANVLGSAFNAALNTVTNAIGTIGTKFNESVELETSMISTVGTIMKLMGSTYKESAQFVDNFNDKMSIVAAALPGATGDYVQLGNGIMDNLIPAFKDLDGVLDKAAYNKTLEGITKNAGFLAVTSGTDIKLATQSLSKLIGGASFDQLKNLKFFEANPAVLGFVEREAEKLGKKFQDMSARERAEVIDRALAIPDEVIKASTESIAGLTAAFQSSLFDPQTGVFGLMKDLEKEVDGKQTAYAEISKTFNLLFGTSGILNSLGRIFSELTGTDVNSPMEALRDGFMRLNDGLRYISVRLTMVNTSLATGLDDGMNKLGKIFNSVFGKLDPSIFGAQMAKMFNASLPYLFTIMPYVINGISDGILFIFSAFGTFLSNLDYGAIFSGVGYVLSNLNWGSLATVAFGAISVAVLQGLTAMAVGVFAASNIAAVIGSAVTVLGLVVTAPITLIGAGIALGIGLIGLAVYNHIDAIEAGLTYLLTGIVSNITKVAEFITNGFNVMSGIAGELLVDFENLLTYLLQIPAKLMQQATSFLSNTFSTAGISFSDGDIPNRAEGFIPNGVLKAAMAESKAMPLGSNLVVANSSEAVLNRSQQESIAQSVTSSRSATLQINGGINIYTNNGNAEEIADQVMASISRKWEQSKQNFNLPSYT